MTVYTTILANYLFWIAQHTMTFLWSPRKWQCVGMWGVQGNELKAGNSGHLFEQLQSQCFAQPSAGSDSTPGYSITSAPSWSPCWALWTWQPGNICVWLCTQGYDWGCQRGDSELHSHSLAVQHAFRFSPAAHSFPKHLKPLKQFCQNSAKVWFPQAILILDFSFLNLNSIGSTFANLEWLFHCWHNSSELISRTDKEASGTEN